MSKQTVILDNKRSVKLPTSWRKRMALNLTDKLVGLIARSPITPNAITWSGFIISLAAAALVIYGQLLVAGLVAIVGGFLDMVDGGLARRTDRVTSFGSVLDSTLDRLSEAAILMGILVYFTIQDSTAGIIITALALPSSMMVSYLRAKAEAMDMTCEVGLLTRPERVIILTLGLLLGGIDYVLLAAVSIVTALSFITAGQRFAHIRQQTRRNKSTR